MMKCLILLMNGKNVLFVDEQQQNIYPLDGITWDLIKFLYAPGTLNNFHTQQKWYSEFCLLFGYTEFPVIQWQLVRYATYLSFTFKSPQAVCKILLPVSLVVHNILHGVGEYCESVPLDHTGSYILSASM